MRFVLTFCFLSVILAPSFVLGQFDSGWKAHDLNRPQPQVVKPGDQVGGAPADAVVLFDGTDMSMWTDGKGGEAKWKVVDGAMESVPKGGFVYSKEEFGDCQVHIEFASPAKAKGSGQGRGNSGVFLMGEFEIQVLDSFDNKTYADGGAGSLYGQYPPLVNVSRPPGQWQTYDIIFRRPRFSEDGQLTTPAKLTVLHNGILIQDHSNAYGPTSWIYRKDYKTIKSKTKGVLSLQDHGNPVRYRNIWVRSLAESRAQPEQAYPAAAKDFDTQSASKKLVGKYGSHEIVVVDENLVLKFNRSTMLEMVPYSPTEFGFVYSAGKVTFQTDESGNVTGMNLNLDAAGSRKLNRSK
ncbi:MAG: hypothetical protein ACI87E_003248 [Mariniblastus sp.]|jgi:hypothetical protein